MMSLIAGQFYDIRLRFQLTNRHLVITDNRQIHFNKMS